MLHFMPFKSAIWWLVHWDDGRDMIKDMIQEGQIVPSQVTVRLLLKAMEDSKGDKFLIDGFPRTDENREVFERMVPFLLHCQQEALFSQLGSFCISIHVTLRVVSQYLKRIDAWPCLSATTMLWRPMSCEMNYKVYCFVFVQTGIVPEFILFFDCPEDEMERRVLGRNQVQI